MKNHHQRTLLLIAVTALLVAFAGFARAATDSRDSSDKPAVTTERAGMPAVLPLCTTQVYRIGDNTKTMAGRQYALVAIVMDPESMPAPTDSAGPLWLFNGRAAAAHFMTPLANELPIGESPPGAWIVWMPVPPTGDIDLLHGLVRPNGPLPSDARIADQLLEAGATPICTTLALLPRVGTRRMAELTSAHARAIGPAKNGLVAVGRDLGDASGTARSLTIRLPIDGARTWNNPAEFIRDRRKSAVDRQAWQHTREALIVGDTVVLSSGKALSAPLRQAQVEYHGRSMIVALPQAVCYEASFTLPGPTRISDVDIRHVAIESAAAQPTPAQFKTARPTTQFRWTAAQVDSAARLPERE